MPAVAGVTAANGVRGLLIGLDLHRGTITVGRSGFPPTEVPVSAAASITRDGLPAHLTDLESGSVTALPDRILAVAAGSSGGTPIVMRIKATSRDHFWYGQLTSLDPSNATLVVTRADGQRHAFQMNNRTNVLQFGSGNVSWSTLHTGMVVEVDWIPGDNGPNTPVLQAHSVVLNKPYEGIQRR